MGLALFLFLAPACGGGGGEAPALRGDGVLSGQLLPEQSPGSGPSPLFLTAGSGEAVNDPHGDPWEDRLDRIPVRSVRALLAGPPPEGRVGAPGDPQDLIRVANDGESLRLRIHVEGALDLRTDFLQGSPADPARELRQVAGSGDLILGLERGDALIIRLRTIAVGVPADWRLLFEALGPDSLQMASLGGTVQDAEARRSLLRQLLLPGRDRSATGEVIVTLGSSGSAAHVSEVLSARGLVLLEGSGQVQRWSLPAMSRENLVDDVDREWAMSQLLGDLRAELGALATFDPNLVSPPTSTACLQSTGDPNDPFYASWQWNMTLSRMDKAWATSTGASTTTIAVMDTGLLTQHPDLKDRVSSWSYDFISDKDSAGDGDGPDADPQEPPEFDIVSLFHGTYVAGVLGASTNNKIGVAGGTWKGKILGIRVIGKKGMTSWDRIQAWRYMAGLSNSSNKILPKSERPRVLNMSWTVDTITQAESDALDALSAAGTILVAAMGNDGQKDSKLRYPAAHTEVIAVGAVDQGGKVTTYSNGGSYIDVVGPGGVGSGVKAAVLSTWARKPLTGPGYEYGYYSFQGTSLATPIVCATIALMDTQQPGIELPMIRRIIREGSVDLGAAGWDKEYGHGLLDASEYLRLAKLYDKPPVLSVTPTSRVIMDSETETLLTLDNKGGRVLRDFVVQAQGAVSGALGFRFDAGYAPTRLHVTVDRGKVAVASYQDRYLLSSNGGSATLDFSYRKPIPTPPGPVEIQIRDGGQTLVTAFADAQGRFRLDTLPSGSFRLVAGIDLDQNGRLGDPQEWYLELPVQISSGNPLDIGPLQVPWRD